MMMTNGKQLRSEAFRADESNVDGEIYDEQVGWLRFRWNGPKHGRTIRIHSRFYPTCILHFLFVVASENGQNEETPASDRWRR
jgi:hypothetical protein